MLGDRAHRQDDGDLSPRRDYSNRSCTVRFPPTQGPPGHRRDSGDRSQHGPGRLACPNCNRQPYMKDEQCAACRRVGHVAKHCDMPATAICLEKYMEKHLSPKLRDQVEKSGLTVGRKSWIIRSARHVRSSGHTLPTMASASPTSMRQWNGTAGTQTRTTRRTTT
jgi:hypothetical protein